MILALIVSLSSLQACRFVKHVTDTDADKEEVAPKEVDNVDVPQEIEDN